ncbi:MAG: ATP-binding protein [Flexilinea sp.]
MEKEETILNNLFQEFQFSFNQAAAEEKKRLLTQLYSWVQEQTESPEVPSSAQFIGNEPEERESPPLNRPEEFQPENHQNPIFQDLHNLLEREIHLGQIAENIEQVLWLLDNSSDRILYVSPAFETVWGRSCESLYADSQILIESVHPEDRVQVMVAKNPGNNKPFNQVYRILRPDGGLRWIFARTFLIPDKTGKSDCQFCIAQDISDQKEIELALRKTLDRTRELFGLSRKMSLARKPDAVLKTVLSAHDLRSAQRAALLIFENPQVGPSRGMELTAAWQSDQNISPWLSESSLYEEPAFWDLLQSNRTVVISRIDSDPRLTPLVRDFLMEGQIRTFVIFPLVASREWRGCLVVYYNENYYFDHTELRQLKVLLDQAAITLYNLRLLEVEEESRHEAERANEIKTEFLAMISHELRTPLTSIIGFTTTLLAEDVTWNPDEQYDFIQTIQREADRLQELIDHLLDLSSLEAGMLPIELELHSLHEIIEDALPQFFILTSGQTLTVNLPDNLPPVFVDAKRIAQVLVNLVRNASTYAPKETEINISACVRENFVQINVTDQGPGIQPVDYKKVFMAFRRGANIENKSVQGAGLGLAICKGLIEAHGGRIWIKKKNTPGATISFTIPLFSPESIPENLTEEEH